MSEREGERERNSDKRFCEHERFMLIGKTKNMFIIAKEDIDRINCFSYKQFALFL